MKNWKAVSVGLIAGGVFALGASRAFAYGDASDEGGLGRSPFFSQQTLDSDIRLRGMGFLTLPVQDDSNTIGVFKYGDLSSCLALDYRGQRKAELGYWFESGEAKDKGPGGGKLFDSDGGALTGMGAFHFDTNGIGDGAVAFGFQAESDKQDFPGSSIDNKPDLGTFYIGYGHHVGNWILGIGGRSVDTTLFKFGSVKAEMELTDVDLSGGYLFHPAEGQELALVLGPRLRTQKTTFDTGTSEDVGDLDGVAVTGGLNYTAGDTFRGGLFVTSGKLEGDEKTDGSKVGEGDTTQTEVNLRGFFRPTGSAFSFGGLVETTSNDTTGEDLTGAKNLDDKTTDLAVGAGAAIHAAEDRGLLGREVRLLCGEVK
jgi:hypothetical protein